MSDAINPDHYKRLPAEAIEIIEAAIQNAPDNIAAYNHGQQLKYDLRLFEKGKTLREYLIDQEKHCWYSDRLREHLRKLVEQEDKYEQQKASDLQSLKDHPFGRLKQPAWTPKIGDWVRIKKPAETRSDAGVWFEMMDEHDGKILQVEKIEYGAIVYDNLGFLFDWLEPAEPPKEQQQPPDGWRILEEGEVVRKGDRFFNGAEWKDRDWAIGKKYSPIHQKTIRRNRFDVGEKVIDCRVGVVFTVQHFNKEYSVVFVDGVSKGIESKHLAPYIEDAK